MPTERLFAARPRTTMIRAFRVSPLVAAAVGVSLAGCASKATTQEVVAPAAASTAPPTTKKSADPGKDDSGVVESKCTPVGDITKATAKVEVDASEFKYIVDSESTKGGLVGFTVKNTGNQDHEVVIARAKDTETLPKNPDGTVNEDGIPTEDFIGEVEKFPAGESCTGVFDLKPGNYVLFCAIDGTRDKGEQNHFVRGMRSNLKVT